MLNSKVRLYMAVTPSHSSRSGAGSGVRACSLDARVLYCVSKRGHLTAEIARKIFHPCGNGGWPIEHTVLGRTSPATGVAPPLLKQHILPSSLFIRNCYLLPFCSE